MQIVCIHTPYSFLVMRERKETRKKNKIEIFTFDFLDCERINGTLWIYLTLELAKTLVSYILHKNS